MVDKYYNSQKFNHIIKYFEGKFSTPFEFYYSLGNFFEDKGYFNKNIGNTEYYKVFLDFNEMILKESDKYLKEIIRFNYLIYNKRRGLPEFVRSDMSKEEEKSIKEELREEYSFKEYQLEKFNIDIERYISNNEILETGSYYIFNDNSKYIHLENK